MTKNLTLLKNTRTDIFSVDKKNFIIAPDSMNLPIVYVRFDNESIFISEEDISKKGVLLDVFEENSGFSSGIQKFSSTDEDLIALVDQDPLILSELYVLFEEQHNVDSKKLWALVKLLLNEFSFDIILAQLIAAPLEDVENLINETDYQKIKKTFMEL